MPKTLAILTVSTLCLLAAAAPAHAQPDEGKPTFSLLKHSGEYNPRPSALTRLSWEIAKRTSIEVSLEQTAMSPDDPAIRLYPFQILAGSGHFDELSEKAVRNLRSFLNNGGFLLIDGLDAAFDDSVRRFLQRVLPNQPLTKIPAEHVLYKTFYLLDGPAGRVRNPPYLEGVFIDDRLAVIYSRLDLLGAWARDSFGNWVYEVEPGGNAQRERSFRLGINIVMYAMCLDYKNDAVHLPFILRRRK